MVAKREDASFVGRAIYKEKILPLLKADDKGKVVVIDVNSGDYEIDYDDAAAMFRLIERRPRRLHLVRACGISGSASHGVVRLCSPSMGNRA